MTNFPQFEVAISDADRAEIEAIYIELMRERGSAAQGETEAIEPPPMDLFKDSESQ